MPTKDNVQIAPAEGKLGVLIPGMGAVTTTFIAGVEAIKRGLGKPIGSLTQMGTVRLGKRTEGRTPKIKDFVPLADPNDLDFGGWDIFEDNAYEAAVKAGVLETLAAGAGEGAALGDQADEGGLRPEFVKRINGPNVKTGGIQDGPGRDGDGRHPAVPEDAPASSRMVMIWCGSTEVYHQPAAVHASAEGFRVRAAEERSGDLAQPDLRVRGAEDAASRTPTARRT